MSATEMVRSEISRTGDTRMAMAMLLGWVDSALERPVTAKERRDIREAIALVIPAGRAGASA